MPLSDFPRHPLTFGPSPIHPLKRLSEHLGGTVEIWAKREDVSSGLAYGGNKVRKLEYLVPDALAKGCDTLVSIGGVQSNHTRQVAAVAAHLGLKCVLVQEHWVEWPDSIYDRVGNILMSRIMGADVRLSDAGFDIGFRPSWEEAIASVEASGGTPYAIPAGASDHPLGGMGFAHWAMEVEQQEQALDIFFDTIVVCSVTGSTSLTNVQEKAPQADLSVVFDKYSLCVEALNDGRVEAVTTDNIILLGFVADSDGELKIVGGVYDAAVDAALDAASAASFQPSNPATSTGRRRSSGS